nr:DUF397 domain-containing protein [Micromonospora rubida]
MARAAVRELDDLQKGSCLRCFHQQGRASAGSRAAGTEPFRRPAIFIDPGPRTTTPELSGVTWRKSTRSGPHANSVEVTPLTEAVAVREKDPMLAFAPVLGRLRRRTDSAPDRPVGPVRTTQAGCAGRFGRRRLAVRAGSDDSGRQRAGRLRSGQQWGEQPCRVHGAGPVAHLAVPQLDHPPLPVVRPSGASSTCSSRGARPGRRPARRGPGRTRPARPPRSTSWPASRASGPRTSRGVRAPAGSARRWCAA